MITAKCEFCGLRVSAARGVVAEGKPQPVFCCFGCEFASEVTRSSGSEGASRILLLRIGLAAFCTMNVLAFTMVLWTHDVYPGTRDVRAVVLDDILRYLGLLFSLPVWFVLGQPMLNSAMSRLRRGIPATDLLVCLGVVAAYGFSIISTWRGSGAVYYEVACVILVLITLGRWLESQGKLQATSALDDLGRLLPEIVRVRTAEKEVSIPLAEVCVGDRILMNPGDCICVDGVITAGRAHIDQRLLTGESSPVEMRVGDAVHAGAFNLDGHLELTASSTADDGSLGRLVRCLREARQHRGAYERLAENVATWFLPAIVVVALASVSWHGWYFGLETGVMTGLSVLLIACPCALGLATPLAAWTAFGCAVRHQVLFRDGEAIERLAGIKALAWDKTGTLTTTKPRVETVVWSDDAVPVNFQSNLLELAQRSNHPFSYALVNSWGRSLPSTDAILEVKEHSGRGMIGRCRNGSLICLGSERLVEDVGFSWPARLHDTWLELIADCKSVVIGGADGVVRCLVVIAESLRPGAADTVYQLQILGIHQQLLTGDHAPRAARLLEQVFATRQPGGRPKSTGYRSAYPDLLASFTNRAELSPSQKADAICSLRLQHGPVAMVGDGVNDALALAESDVGIALQSGADISRDTAAVCLFGDDLGRVPWAIEYAQLTVRIMRQNLAWAFGYNTIGVGLAAAGYLNPSLAAVLMVGSSSFVIANSWRLQLGLSDSRDQATLSDASTSHLNSIVMNSCIPPSPSLEGARGQSTTDLDAIDDTEIVTTCVTEQARVA